MFNKFVIATTVCLSVLAVSLIANGWISANVEQILSLYFVAFLVSTSVIGVFVYYLTGSSNRGSVGYSLVSDSEDNYVAPTDIQMVDIPKKLLTMDDIHWNNSLNFMLNGTQITLDNPDPSEMLASFIREKAGLKGTKLGCEEVGLYYCLWDDCKFIFFT